MSDASEPLLRMIRELMVRRGLNTAAVADAAQLERARVRRVLQGSVPMTVDELMKLGQALHIGPADLGLPEMETGMDTFADAPPGDEEEDDGVLGLDPWGNHPEQLFRVGFELGSDFMFVADTSKLEESGIPAPVLAQFVDRDLPIKLDAAYHRYNQPRYSPEGVTLTLSFDSLFECRFPWAAIRQVIFFPAEPEDDEPPEEKPVLRLVT